MIELTRQIEMLPKMMDAAHMRHQVISQNIANINTPGYRRLDVNFEEQFAKALRSESPEIHLVQPEIVEDTVSPARADGNNVDVDREVGQLNKNAMLFQMYSRLLKSQFDSMRRAIQGPNG